VIAGKFAVKTQLAVAPFLPIDPLDFFYQDAFNRVHRYNLMPGGHYCYQ
jgi:hypothetical protein